ncbi:hypothetical protein ASPFODRAFT_148698 [Aspergillus luchuensis CBS 106.47]|uniref:Carrier domain-containing protein n=1 Tax=Aspergillus luchuensis (strain CBS 106.47) TaxID=1137211 RepID=A0A1M3SYZ9_ASPLC|nr:hypothetical protein ASPFODRAFT_148698 [Aspergillus luchuensis CBS 106.47]
MVSEEDRRQMKAWNGEVPARVERCVHELVAERCRAQPDAPAVCAWDGDFTYGELDARSSALAAHLAARGVGPEVFVPLCFEKSRWTTVAMLAVMKAGGAFVLLDPSHPPARRREICRAVSANLIVASAEQAAAAGDLETPVVVVDDARTTTWPQSSTRWEGSPVKPDNALYAVFTSGSTGTPKGVVIPHAAFATSVVPYGRQLRVTSVSRVLQFSSYAFDASIMDTFIALVFGGCLCIPSKSAWSNDISFTVQQYGVNCAELTPSLLRMLDPQDVQTLKTVVAAGEPLCATTVKKWSRSAQLINAYGPAECSVACAVQTNITAGSDPRNIGWASGCVSWVVDRDDHERLVPIGAVGELLIEGPIVGRGYLNDSEKTAAVFIEPPAWLHEFRGSGTGGRLYKTGDLVQYAADGSLRFVGRKDTQVKLRGQRIELGETDRWRLRDRAAALSRADIEAYHGAAVARRAPATPVERTLQQLWAKVLNIPAHTIGMDDSFFRLGGDSIAAMRLAGAARGDGLVLTVADIFRHQSISQHAPLISRACSNPALATTPDPFSLLGLSAPEPFIHQLVTLHRSWSYHEFIDALPTTQQQAEYVHSRKCSYFLLDISGPIDPDRLRYATHALAERHSILRSAFFSSSKGLVQGTVRTHSLSMARYTCCTDILQFSTDLCREDSKTLLPFGVLPFQVSLVSGERHSILILRLSHAQYDGLCLPVLYHDLAAAYRGEAMAEATPFSLYMQYRLSRKSTEVFQFWRDYLHGATMTQLDYSALGGVDRASFTEIAVTVTKKIPLPCPPPGITVATLVKAAWSFILVQLTRQTDLVFGQTVSGRSVPVPNVENILGPCVNAVPIRVTFQPAWTALDLLQHTQDQHARVLPFETTDLRDIVKHSTTWSDSADFGIVVQHDNVAMNAPFSLAGVGCTPSIVAFQVPRELAISSNLSGDSLALRVSAPNWMVNSESAATILDDLCQAILSFTHDPCQLLSLF